MAEITNTNDPPKMSTKGFGNELGASGTFIASGIITLEEYNSKLSGQQGRKTFDIMRRSDGSVHAALQACKLPILSIDYDIEPASDEPNDIYAAEFVKRELFDRNINWHAFIREALTMFEFGFSVFEKTYEITEFDGKVRIGLQKIGSRKQRTILYWQTADGKPGIQQQLLGASSDGKYGIISVPAEKLIIFTNEKEGDNYEGISLLRFAYKDFDMKDKLGLVNAIALEKMGVGVPVLSVPSDASEDEKRKARDALRQFRANEEAYIELPGATDGWKVEMLDMKANTVKDVLPSIQYHDRQIMASVLAQFLHLGASGGSGSKALSQDHSQMFMMSEEAAVKTLVSTIQQELIQQLCDLNFTDMPNGYPKLTSGRVADDSIINTADAINKLMSVGAVTPDPGLESWLRETLHAPELPDDLETDDEEIEKTGKTTETDPAADPSLKVDPKQEAKTQAALKAAKRVRKQLIDTLVN